jgi:hypothetical protein
MGGMTAGQNPHVQVWKDEKGVMTPSFLVV